MVDDDGELVGLSLIRDKSTRAGSFPHAVLGYEKQTVDAYVRELEKDRDNLRRDVRDLERRLRTADAGAKQSDLTQLTGHASVLLTAAEAQSEELATQATLDAERLRDEGRRAADELRAGGQQEADDIRATAMAALRELRERQHEELTALHAQARSEAAQAVTAARRSAEAVALQAEHAAGALRTAAQQEANAIVTAAERYAAEIRAAALADRERVLTEATTALADLRQRCEALLADATAQHADSSRRLVEEAEAAAAIRAQASVEAEQVRVAAYREAEQHFAATHRQAAELRQRLEAEADRRKNRLASEVAALQQRKQAIATQLRSIGSLGVAAADDYPDQSDDWPATILAAPSLPVTAVPTVEHAEEPGSPAPPAGAPDRDVSVAGLADEAPTEIEAPEGPDATPEDVDDPTDADPDAAADPDPDRTVIRPPGASS